jgi:hypothetical protein
MKNSSAADSMQGLARRLIAEDEISAHSMETPNRSAFSVCAKLRRPLCTLAGVAGFRSLLSRALMLAREEAPWLRNVEVTPKGTFQYAPEVEGQLASPEAARAAQALTRHLLGLLITFIGEALTLRLVHDVWPNVATQDSKPRENQP